MRIRYDYKCENCGLIEEHKHSISESPEFTCPECGTVLHRIPSVNGNFILKGGDWPDKMRRRGDIKYDPPKA